MPIYETQVDGKPHKVELTKTAQNVFTATVDERTHKAEIEIDKFNPGKACTLRMDDKAYTIHLPSSEQEKVFLVKVEEATFKVEVRTYNRRQALTSFEPAPTAPLRKATSAKQIAVEGTVTAPMTGKIVSVKVKKGEQVKASQVLCVIEAMKMENEIVAPKAGTVQEVKVQDGSSVDEGETLFVVA